MDDFSFDFAFDTSSFDDDGDELETARTLDAPLLYARHAAKRQTIAAQKQENLARLMPTLPPPDTDLLILGTAEGKENVRTGLLDSGAFDFGSFIPHGVELLGGHGITCYCSTWVLNRQHVEMFTDLLDAGRLAALHVLSDPFLKRRHTSAVYGALVTTIQAHPPSRLKLFENHAKILCLAAPEGSRFLSVQGSSNLTSVQRVENYHVSTAPEVYHFYVEQFFLRILGHAASKRR